MMLIAFLLVLINTQLIKKVSNCLDSCQSCPLYEPSKCISNQSLQICQQSYLYNKTSQKCILKSYLDSNFVSLQLTQQHTSSIQQTQITTWKQGKVSQCSYIDQQGLQKYINVIGLFREIYSISKEFDISEHHQTYFFSFNLVRNSWMPHNDFLIVDIQAGTELLGSYQISYDNREGFTDYSFISCNGEQVVTQKFNIKVNYKSFKTNKIKITFTGFLFTSVWGITNVKFIPGCQKFTVFNKLTGDCDFCDLGFFSVSQTTKNSSINQLTKCSKCPYQCSHCLNSTYCNSCIKGYRLLANYTCIPNDDFIKIELKDYFNSEQKNCRVMNLSFFHNTQNNEIKTLDFTNSKQKSFGNIYIVFEFVYNVKFWSTGGKVQVLLNKNVVSQISNQNLTNKGFQTCSSQSLQRYTIQKIIVLVTNISQKINITFKLTNLCIDCKFGIANLNFFYSESNSIDSTQLQNIKTFSSQKQAVQSIQFKTGQTSQIVGASSSQQVTNEFVTIIPFKNSSQQKIGTSQNQLNNTTDQQTQGEQSNNKSSSQTNNDKNSTSNLSFIDHLAFSKSGNNGLVIRLDKKLYPISNDGTTYIMQLSSTAKDEVKKNQVSSVLYKSQLYVVRLMLTEQNTEQAKNLFSFSTDKTYLSDKATIYTVKNNIKSKLVTFQIERTDYLEMDSQNVISAFQTLFSTFAWITIFLVILALLSGKAYLIQESVQAFQFILLGIYIFTSYLPASIVNTISGLRRLQNFDIFALKHMVAIEDFLLGNLVQQGPLRFTLFHKDINFIRGIIPLLFFGLMIGIWFLVMVLFSMKRNQKNKQNQDLINDNNLLSAVQNVQSSNLNCLDIFEKFVGNDITSNKLDYWIQVFKLMFLPFIFLSFKQFNNFSYPDENNGQIFNMLFCLLIFIAFLMGAVALVVYCSKQYYKLEYEIFIKSFPSIYYKKIPINCLPTEYHRIVYPLLRYFKIFLFCLLVALLGIHTIIVFVLMIVINAGQIFYAWLHQIYQDTLHFKFLFIESLMLSVLLLIQLILSEISGVISTSGYLAFGYVYMSIAIVLMINGFIRCTYLIFDYINLNKKNKSDGIPSQRIV